MKYRSDIDGLRALAILPVVAFHAGLPVFSGGFVGVDVFFVISGFLITSVIAAEMAAGNFTISGFYERRMRRLFPALFLVIATTLVVGWLIYTPLLYKALSQSAIWAALFGSNFFFWNESGYFSGASATKPLLHTWSLAVEEQFYVFFPLLLLFLRRFQHWTVLLVLSGLAIISFVASVVMVARAPDFAFYLLPTRFWELLLGALLAFAAPAALTQMWQRTFLAVLGFLAILLPALFYTAETDFPGLAALPPSLGTVALIYAGTATFGGWNPLSSRLAVFVGLISYPLYLWHWPLIAFWVYWTGASLSMAHGALVVALSFLLAWLTFRYVERPFRKRTVLAGQVPLFRGGVAAMLGAALAGFGISHFDGVPNRLPESIRGLYVASQDRGDFSGGECLTGNEKQAAPEVLPEGAGCILGTPSAAPDFVLWGDSHAAAFAPGLDMLAKELGISGILLARASCPPLLKFYLQKNRRNGRQCENFNDSVLQYIKDKHIRKVVMVARWARTVHRSGFGNEGIFYRADNAIDLTDRSAPMVSSLEATLAKLAETGTAVSIVYDAPEIGFNVPETVARDAITGHATSLEPAFEAVMNRQALARHVISAAATKYQLAIVDPASIFCDPKSCHVGDSESLFYADEDHLNARGAAHIRVLFKPYLQSRAGMSAQ
jgi:peptidoglycan/LPS O-acetylase OafA/YrhL